MSLASLICLTRSSVKCHREIRKISSSPGTQRSVVIACRGWCRSGVSGSSVKAWAAESLLGGHGVGSGGRKKNGRGGWPRPVVKGPPREPCQPLLLPDLLGCLPGGKLGGDHVRHSFAVAFRA